MIRSAGIPMVSMDSEASKKLSRVSGNSWKIRKPTAMMAMAVKMVSRTVFHTRWGRAAPKL